MSLLLIGTIAILCWLPAGLVAQKGKGKPPAPPDIPGVAEIVCLAGGVLCDDGGGPYVDGAAGAIVELRTSDAGNFIINTGTGSRYFTVTIPPRDTWEVSDCPAPCVANVDPVNGLVIPTGWDNTYVAASRDGGLASLPIGVPTPTQFLIGFPAPNGSGQRWSLYWDPGYYEGTEYATVTRTDACTWEIGADDKLAGFWLFKVGKGAKGNVQEGRFRTSFHITFVASGCAA
ncbi:MAG TPA: hypothetical protein VFO19_08630 [Vicinamibacterales bacterium]|nr:hypothetical protein [Vicinamibacterales bacterium]